MKELKHWHNILAIQAPQSCVIIIGTHPDEMADKCKREVDEVLHRARTLSETYKSELQIVEIVAVGLKNHIKNVDLLKKLIYHHAAKYRGQNGHPIMGQKIPASYHALFKQLTSIAQGIDEPILGTEEFSTMVYQMNLADIQNDEELKRAIHFLTDVSSLLHFDDHGHDLRDLYFVNPRWLYETVCKIVNWSTVAQKDIIHTNDIYELLKNNCRPFPLQYFECPSGST